MRAAGNNRVGQSTLRAGEAMAIETVDTAFAKECKAIADK